MRSYAAFVILMASGRLFCAPVSIVVHALPCVQKPLSMSSSASPYPPSCLVKLNNASGPIEQYDHSGTISSRNVDPPQNTYLTPTLVLTLALFVTFVALLIVLLFFGANIRSFLFQKRPKEEKPKLGFGFDGLSKEEFKGLRLKEEQAADMKKHWFHKLPTRPPALVLRDSGSPLLPIEIPSKRDNIEGFRDVKLDDVRAGHRDASVSSSP